jgi:HSP20 family protein
MSKSLNVFEPLNLIRPTSTFERMFEDFFGSERNHWIDNVPQCDIYETAQSVVYKMSAPGVNSEDVKVTIDNNILKIRGETKNDIVDETTQVYKREMRYGLFSRSFRLPTNIVLDNASAAVENGVVTVTIPKKSQESQAAALEIPINRKSLPE